MLNVAIFLAGMAFCYALVRWPDIVEVLRPEHPFPPSPFPPDVIDAARKCDERITLGLEIDTAPIDRALERAAALVAELEKIEHYQPAPPPAGSDPETPPGSLEELIAAMIASAATLLGKLQALPGLVLAAQNAAIATAEAAKDQALADTVTEYEGAISTLNDEVDALTKQLAPAEAPAPADPEPAPDQMNGAAQIADPKPAPVEEE